MDINPEQELVFSGSGEGEMKAWKIDHEALAQGLQETDTGEVRSASTRHCEIVHETLRR